MSLHSVLTWSRLAINNHLKTNEWMDDKGINEMTKLPLWEESDIKNGTIK